MGLCKLLTHCLVLRDTIPNIGSDHALKNKEASYYKFANTKTHVVVVNICIHEFRSVPRKCRAATLDNANTLA